MRSYKSVPTRTEAPTVADMMDETNPSSILYRTKGSLHEKIKNLPKEYLVDEHNLRKHFGFKTKREHIYLRQGFWQEYDRALRTDSKMETGAIYKGVVLDEIRFFNMIDDPCLISYMLLPVFNYDALTKGAHEYALSQLHDILALPHTDEEGKVNTTLLNQKLKIFKMLDDRIKGAVLQRQEIVATNRNLNINQEMEAPREMNPAQIEARIKELEESLTPQALLEARTVVTEDE